MRGMGLPLFECTRRGHKLRTEYDLSYTGDVKRIVEKAPECCGKSMNETLDD